MKIHCAFFALFISWMVSAQNPTNYDAIDQKMSEIPINATQSTTAIADYIKTHFSAKEDQLRAAFYWTATNLSYDVENMFNQPLNQTSQDKINRALTTKKGVCMHYSEVFASLANQLGIPTVLIEGYTKTNGKVDPTSHQWCASKVNNRWSLYDPTWGAGYVNNQKYYPKLNNFYYNTAPNELIINHMPFDYIWQLLEKPITNQEFFDGKTESSTTAIFDYNTAIETHEKLTKKEKCIAFWGRMKENGLTNQLVTERMKVLEKEIEYFNQTEKVGVFTSIANLLKETGNDYNQCVKWKNNQFNGVSDDELKNKIDRLVSQINQCEKDAHALNMGKENAQNLISLKKGIADLKNLIIDLQLFTNNYLSKTPDERKKMFVRTVVKRR